MSPSEFDLRAALHEGEGDVPDAGLVIAKATRARFERRRRINAIASGVAVAAAVAAGLTYLAQNNTDESGGAGGGAAASVPAFAGPGGLHRGATADGPSAASSNASGAEFGPARRKAEQLACPAHFPQQALPGGGGTDQFGSSQRLFSGPVAAMKVCAYGPGTGSVELGADRAQALAAALNAAPTTGDPLQCLVGASRYAIYAVSPAGIAMRVVTAQAGCRAYHVTNGTAVRYVPLTEFDALHLSSVPSLNQGSPVKS